MTSNDVPMPMIVESVVCKRNPDPVLFIAVVLVMRMLVVHVTAIV